MILRRFAGALGGCLVFLFGACNTGPFAKPTAEERIFDAEPVAVWAEARAFLEQRGYTIRGSRAGSGRIEAFSPVEANVGFGDARQRRLRIKVVEEAPRRSRMEVTATVLEEADGPAGDRATFERPLRDPIFFEVFFDEIAARLERRKTD